MNPARTFGPDLVTGNFPALWVYLVGPPLGALLAVALFAVGARERRTLTAKLFHDPSYPTIHATALPARPHPRNPDQVHIRADAPSAVNGAMTSDSS